MRDKKRNGGERGARWRKVNGLGKQDIDDVWDQLVEKRGEETTKKEG